MEMVSTLKAMAQQEPISIVGPCGSKYCFKPEYGGVLVKCPNCRKVYRVPNPKDQGQLSSLDRYVMRKEGLKVEVAGAAVTPAWQKAFDIHQEFLTSDETYLLSEAGQTALLGVAERGRRFHNVAILLALAIMAFVIAGAARAGWIPLLPAKVFSYGIASLICAALILRFKFFPRPIVFWETPERTRAAFFVRDMNRIEFPNARFRVEDRDGQVIGELRKPWFGDVFRSYWHVMDGDGQKLMVAREDSFVLSMMRRVLITKLWWFRTNFVIMDASSETVLGELKRKWTVKDHYRLDLTGNTVEVDVRLLWALAVLLDTAERR